MLKWPSAVVKYQKSVFICMKIFFNFLGRPWAHKAIFRFQPHILKKTSLFVSYYAPHLLSLQTKKEDMDKYQQGKRGVIEPKGKTWKKISSNFFYSNEHDFRTLKHVFGTVVHIPPFSPVAQKRINSYFCKKKELEPLWARSSNP